MTLYTRRNLAAYVASALLASALCASPLSASTQIVVQIDISDQKLRLSVNGSPYATWAVSTARRNYRTPLGSFRPYWLHQDHYSSIYDNAPMPYSVFFHGGYAIHGTNDVASLGKPVSHGCVRLKTRNAGLLFGLIQKHGYENTLITIVR